MGGCLRGGANALNRVVSFVGLSYKKMFITQLWMASMRNPFGMIIRDVCSLETTHIDKFGGLLGLRPQLNVAVRPWDNSDEILKGRAALRYQLGCISFVLKASFLSFLI